MMCLNRTSEWKVMTIWISRELPLFNFERLDIWCAWIGHPSENLWSFKFLRSFRCSILSFSIYYAPESDIRVKSYCRFNMLRASVFHFELLNIICAWIGSSIEKLWPFEFLENFHCSIPSFSIYYPLESDLCVISCDHLNFSTTSVVDFRASLYVSRLNRTSEIKVMTI